MTQPVESILQSFVLLGLGERRFAVAAAQISELVSPSRIFRFPHRTPKLEGVILRRGRIVPVCDVAEKLLGKAVTSRRFYLIAVRHYGDKSEWVALPVTGDCELIANGEVIEVLNLDALTPGGEDVVDANTPVAVLEVRP
jgi:chemotaxis signal transduction protein